MKEQLVIGVDLGGTTIRAAAVDSDGAIVRRVERPTPVDSQQHLIEALEGAICEVVTPEVAAIGVAVPSRIDRVHGRAISSTNVPLGDLDLRDEVARRFGLPVEIENDATAAAIGEWSLGAGRGVRDMVMITLGTGIGGGLILDGKPFRGATGAAAEIGHIVIDVNGPPCQGSCTGHGHLEGLASGTAATKLAREIFGPEADARTLVDRAWAGDAAAVGALARIGHYLGAAIASLVNLLEPELVVIGGGFSAASDLMLPAARAVLARDGLTPGRDTVRIVLTQLGTDAGLVGAALVGREALAAASVKPV